MIRLLVGLVKGLVVGGALGGGAFALGWTGGWHWLTYGLVGAIVGLVAGQPLWRLLRDPKATAATGILKAIVGYGIGVGLYALVAKAWGGFALALGDETRAVYDWQPILGAAIGGVWGAFVEVDDGVTAAPASPKRPA